MIREWEGSEEADDFKKEKGSSKKERRMISREVDDSEKPQEGGKNAE